MIWPNITHAYSQSAFANNCTFSHLITASLKKKYISAPTTGLQAHKQHFPNANFTLLNSKPHVSSSFMNSIGTKCFCNTIFLLMEEEERSMLLPQSRSLNQGFLKSHTWLCIQPHGEITSNYYFVLKDYYIKLAK